MAKPATATWGTDTRRLHVAYVKSRQVLRLTSDADTTSPLEVPLSEFCHNLGIDATQLGPPCHYLLFARLETNPGGSARHVVETFATEGEAREAYRALRLRRSRPNDWAETVSLDASGRLRPLCWFGTPWGPGGRSGTAVARDSGNTVDETHQKRWIRRWRRRPMNHDDLPISKSRGSSLKGSEAENADPPCLAPITRP